ncbi:MAG: hydroxymethylbilane synthase [Phototrophicaceae bacterium]|jgi:hydroxymethylbilane synthase
MRLLIRFGTRGSLLARWQTDYVIGLLEAAVPYIVCKVEVFSTRGDQVLETPLPLIGGKGVFTAELEAALHEGRIDCAVHSLKDLPTESPDGLTLGAILTRENPADVLVSRHHLPLDALPQGATIGTSSPRRAAQLLTLRPDVTLKDIRGNVDTRIRKALDPNGGYDAIVLAYAGVSRLGHLDAITQVLPLDVMLPAPGQGAIAVQCRADDAVSWLLEAIHDPLTAACVAAERAFLAGLGGGCSVPVAAYAAFDGEILTLRGRVLNPDGTRQFDKVLVGEGFIPYRRIDDYTALGVKLAQQALNAGVHL